MTFQLMRNGSLRVLLAVTLAVAQAGCTTSQNLRSEDRNTIHGVFIDENVKLPQVPFVLTREQGFTMGLAGAVGGAVGGLISGAASATDPNGTFSMAALR
ncbi:MAG: hypothetical protein ACREPT_00585 [Rudaea sp.]